MKSSRASCSARLLGSGDSATVSALLPSRNVLSLSQRRRRQFRYGSRRRHEADHACLGSVGER